MERFLLKDLERWLDSNDRKPLILRGARQVGKTWIVRRLASVRSLKLIEINFEKQPKLMSLFESNDMRVVHQNLEVFYKEKIDPTTTLLFLDEIQAAPVLLAKLRWFAEDYAQLAVIAAGSLLEFLLAEHTFSMPVGRISYAHLGPLSFFEFLYAIKQNQLVQFLQEYDWTTAIPDVIHEKLIDFLKEYVLIGGLPAAVLTWVEEHSLLTVHQIHYNLINTYQDDFNKYNKRIESGILQEVFSAVPQMLGRKFIYSHVNKDRQSSTIKNALELLVKARVCHSVMATNANGVPLGAELKCNSFKIILLDVGLVSTLLGLRLDQVRSSADINFINNGALSEQLVGQLLWSLEPYYVTPKLFYWRREQSNASAEIDYVMQHFSSLVPIEVKSGKTGTLKSLHVFMAQKQLALAVRINSDLPSQTSIDVETTTNQKALYTLLSIPFYLLEKIHDLIG